MARKKTEIAEVETQEEQPRKEHKGRAKGTPNKVSHNLKQAISEMLRKYAESGRFDDDLERVSPKDRLLIVEKFAAYVIPKMQATTLDVSEGKNITIENKLIELAAEQEEK